MILTTAYNKVSNLSKRIRVVQGSSSASKTYSIIQKLILQAITSTDKKLVSIVTDTAPNLYTGAYRDFLTIVDSDNISHFGTKKPREEHINGWTFEFIALDEDLKAKGGRRDILFINEADRIKWEVARQLIIRTREIVYIDYNPTCEFWANTEYIGRDNVDFTIVTYQDNELCPQSAIDEIERYKETDPEWFKVYGLGIPGELNKGRIFPIWEQIDDFPEVDGAWYGLDWGYSGDPAAIIKVLKIRDRIYLDEILYRTELQNSDLVKLLKGSGYRFEPVFCGTDEPKSIQDIRMQGVNAYPADTSPGTVNEGINFLKEHKILVTKRSVNLIKENRLYRWMNDRNGIPLNKPQDRFNHAIDAVRYAFSLQRVLVHQDEKLTIDY